MLKKLTIQNYALIENIEIEFPNGLIIITGETGAGKSILLGALSLLLGAKSDASIFRDNSKNCVVEGEFTDGNEEFILRRVVSPMGRSRSFINDEPTTNANLQEISARLVDIHAQHNHLLLSNAEYQLNILDYYTNSSALLEEYKSIYKELISCKNQLQQLKEQQAKELSEKEYKEFQLNKLIEANIKDGELEELELELNKLSNAERIKESMYGALELFKPMGGSLVQNLKEAANLLNRCSAYIPSLESLVERIESSRIELRDIEQEVESIAEEVVISPDRLSVVDERIGVITSLYKRFNVDNELSLLQIKENLEGELLNIEFSDSRIKELESSIAKLELQLKDASKALTERRLTGILPLAAIIEDRVKGLGMEYAKFKITLEEDIKYRVNGKDKISFLFSANGDSMLPLEKAASGGELSRIMLALKSVIGEFAGMPTMIFDEIDTGVSGGIADKMGDLIGKMGKFMQIFAITHLPQIASKGDAHFIVFKEFNCTEDDQRVATTGIRRLTMEERVKEVARMLSGTQLTKEAEQNARVLLNI